METQVTGECRKRMKKPGGKVSRRVFPSEGGSNGNPDGSRTGYPILPKARMNSSCSIAFQAFHHVSLMAKAFG